MTEAWNGAGRVHADDANLRARVAGSLERLRQLGETRTLEAAQGQRLVCQAWLQEHSPRQMDPRQASLWRVKIAPEQDLVKAARLREHPGLEVSAVRIRR
jgi:hypothetical protein